MFVFLFVLVLSESAKSSSFDIRFQGLLSNVSLWQHFVIINTLNEGLCIAVVIPGHSSGGNKQRSSRGVRQHE